MKRETRIKEVWLTKEEFSCKKCNAKNDDIGWNDKNTDHPANQPENVLFCLKCGHELTKKKELEELVKFPEIQHYGFWLRDFASEHFIPCKKCQDKLHSLLFKNTMWRTTKPDEEPIEMKIRFPNNEWCFVEFKLNFVVTFIEKTPESEIITSYKTTSFSPCKKCVDEVKEILTWKNLHIGIAVKPKIELWRKWHLVEEEK